MTTSTDIEPAPTPMKGVILAGGAGTRLLPMTRVTNKHLLPVYDRPMVYYPIELLRRAGIEEILLVCGGNSAGSFVDLLGAGAEFGLKELAYAYQEGPRGIADALRLAEDFADGLPVVVGLGDNIVQYGIRPAVEAFARQLEANAGRGARILLSEVNDPSRFGVARFDEQSGRLAEIIEKPDSPPSRLAVMGYYLYDASVFELIESLEPSKRNEYEITDVNNLYLERDLLEWSVHPGWWTDAGTVRSLYRATRLVAESGANHDYPDDGAADSADDATIVEPSESRRSRA
ncbi:MAG: sugar phosphate nucleotidyltransferase [Phycisphaerales bacterium]